jgi:hypothetical protein
MTANDDFITTLYTMTANDDFLHYKGVAYGTGKTTPKATLYTMTANRCFPALQGGFIWDGEKLPQREFSSSLGRGKFTNVEVCESKLFLVLDSP